MNRVFLIVISLAVWASLIASSMGAITDISGVADSKQYFTVNVTSGQTKLEVRTSGGRGDCDLYVRLGSRPTTSRYNAKSTGGSNKELVTINNPASGTWYVMLRGYTAYSGLTLSATISKSSAKTVILIHGRTDNQAGYWKQMPTQLASEGYQVKEFMWDKSRGSLSDKASDLAKFISNTGETSIDVVAHSLGVIVFRECIRTDSSIRGKIRRAVLMAGPSFGVDLDGPTDWWSGLSRSIKTQITPGSDFGWDLNSAGAMLASANVLQIFGGKNFLGDRTYGNADGLVAGISARIDGFSNERIVNRDHVKMVDKINNTSEQGYEMIKAFFANSAVPAGETARYKGGGLVARCYDSRGRRITNDPYIKIFKGWLFTYTERKLPIVGGNTFASDQDWGQYNPKLQPIPAGTYMAKRFLRNDSSTLVEDYVTVNDGWMTMDPNLICQ